ncbi:ABC transporter substrate-binding protein [Rhodococcus triatomae]|uniref:Iron complex transport system substrate-binding protein n=1 Tax=Rhodococcus triatomae TaxID=300028 RepID=A0A1G8P1K9_9NOCA|nr:ABC transporter substrate-binding protein [Rhodococcus triatomae]QNG18772.1 ABC transporter substrate-binding protein [Rhodococcus triatomae]QNG25316.1 ABC transporter substrate-binding protein [Rhodococcus triatomae]SDI86431.1 iron complex transport system substrate-binding protein [Rhodococcus triatomae]
MTDNEIRTRPRRAVAVLVALLLGALALTACSADAAEEGSGSGTRVVSTAKGDVTIPAEPARIVALSSAITGYLYTLDAPVVATDTRSLGAEMVDGFPSQWAEKATAQGTTPLPGGDELNLEAIVEARPDLIIGGGQGFTSALADQAYDQLTKIAPTVLISPEITDWREQLTQVADAAGESDRVDGLIAAYDAKVEEVRESIEVPGTPVAYLLSLPSNEPTLIPQTAALPQTLAAVGLVPDDVTTKANDPDLYGTGDSFILSRELLSSTADAPVVFVIRLTGRTLDELAADPLYASLPAFADGNVYELPPTSYRSDYQGVMTTLDEVQRLFG